MSIVAMFPEDHVSVEHLSLEQHLERMSLEANFLVNMIETFKGALPDFSLKIKEINTRLMAALGVKNTYRQGFSSKEKNALFAAKHLDFLNFGARYMMVPESFQGQFLTYLATLNKLVPMLYTAESVVLSEYNLILSSFLTNKDDKVSLKDHTHFFKSVKSQREGFAAELKTFFPKATGTSRLQIKSVLSRMSEVDPLIEVGKKLADQHSQAKLHAISDQTTHCVELLDVLISRVRDGQFESISPNATLNISTGAYEVAKYVEFISVVYYDTMVALNCLDSFLDILTGNTPK